MASDWITAKGTWNGVERNGLQWSGTEQVGTDGGPDRVGTAKPLERLTWAAFQTSVFGNGTARVGPATP